MQKTTLIGNLGRDPEMRYMPSGQAVTNFSVAVNDSYTNKAGEKIETTTWFRISTFGRLAEVCNQYLHRGSKIYAEGKLSVDSSTGGPRVWSKKDGTPSASFELVAAKVEFLSSKRAEEPPQVEAEDIPF